MPFFSTFFMKAYYLHPYSLLVTDGHNLYRVFAESVSQKSRNYHKLSGETGSVLACPVSWTSVFRKQLRIANQFSFFFSRWSNECLALRVVIQKLAENVVTFVQAVVHGTSLTSGILLFEGSWVPPVNTDELPNVPYSVISWKHSFHWLWFCRRTTFVTGHSDYLYQTSEKSSLQAYVLLSILGIRE